jgi:hypothetical protein
MSTFNDCEICYEKTWAPKCTAYNNCDKRVCDDCFKKNWKEFEEAPKCFFCFEQDIRRHIFNEMEDYFNCTRDEPLGEYLERVNMWETDVCGECEIDEDDDDDFDPFSPNGNDDNEYNFDPFN